MQHLSMVLLSGTQCHLIAIAYTEAGILLSGIFLQWIEEITVIEPLSQSLHPKVMLLSRLVGFYKAQLMSPKLSIRFLIRISESDQRTSMGRTLEYIRSKCGLKKNEVSTLTPAMVKRNIMYMPIPEQEQWRLSLMNDILSIKDGNADLHGFDFSEIDEIASYVCSS